MRQRQPRLQRQQQDQVGPPSACDDRPEEQPQQQQDQVQKCMPSLVRYHTAVPKLLLGISYMTSDGRAPSAQEHTPSGRMSRNEYRYTSAPRRYSTLLGILYDKRVKCNEHMSSGRHGRNESRYNIAVPTRQVHKSMRARKEQDHEYTRAFLEIDRAGGAKNINNVTL